MTTQIETLRKKITSAYENENYSEVIDLFNQLEKKGQSLTADDHDYHGRSLYHTENYADAIIAFNKAIKIKPETGIYYIWRGDCYLALKEYADAEQDYRNSIEKNERNPWAYNSLGLFYGGQKKYPQALTEHKKALEIEEKAVFHFNIGICLIETGNIDAALIAFEKAIRLDKKYINAHIQRGRCHYKLKSFEQAIKEFTTALAIQNDAYNHSNTHNWLGFCYEKLDKYDEALEQYNLAIELNDSSAILYTNRGNCYQAMKRIKEALEDYQNALLIDAKYATAHNRIGLCYALKDDQEAIKHYDQAITIEPTNAVFIKIEPNAIFD